MMIENYKFCNNNIAKLQRKFTLYKSKILTFYISKNLNFTRKQSIFFENKVSVSQKISCTCAKKQIRFSGNLEQYGVHQMSLQLN